MRLFLIALIACSACGDPELAALLDLGGSSAGAPFEAEDVLPPSGLLRSSYSLTVKAGHHHSNHDFVARPHLGAHVDRALRFTATFSADAAYRSIHAALPLTWVLHSAYFGGNETAPHDVQVNVSNIDAQ